MYYQTTFSITDLSERRLKGNDLLDAVRVLTEETLTLSPQESTTQRDTSQNSSYWELTVQRPTLDTSGDSIRLEIRAYTDQDQVVAQLVTRYLNRTTAANQELPTFAPALMTTLAQRFDCAVGCTPLSLKPSYLQAHNVRRFIREQVRNPERTIPFLLITRDHRNQTALDPQKVQQAIAGTGHVIVLHRGTENAFREAIGRATYNGKIRLINNDLAARHEYYDRQPDLRHLVGRCLDISQEQDFDGPFTRTVQQIERLGQKTRFSEQRVINDLQAANITLNKRIEELETILLRGDQTEDFVPLPAAPVPPPPAIRLDDEHPHIPLDRSKVHNITLINHAINILRDPLRTYVTKRLRSRFGNAAYLKIAGTIDMRHVTHKQLRANPQSAIDINDLPNIVSNFQKCFNHDGRKAPELARLLRELKAIRNQASHPPPGGISRNETIDKLQVIRQTMLYVGIPHHDPIDHLIAIKVAETRL